MYMTRDITNTAATTPRHAIPLTLLGYLALVDLLLDGASSQEAINKNILFLAITPHTGSGLLVISRVPVRVKQNQSSKAQEQ